MDDMILLNSKNPKKNCPDGIRLRVPILRIIEILGAIYKGVKTYT